MKKTQLIVVLILFLSLFVKAQVDSVYYGAPIKKEKVREKEKPSYNIKEKLSFGGNFMVWFGSSSYVYLSPTVNMAVDKRLNVGAGIVYNYYSIPGFSYSIYGIHTYVVYFLTSNVFAKAELDHLLQPNVYSYNYNDKVWVSYVYIGGGFRQPLGEHAAIYTSILYNINNTPQSVFYSNPQIQIGILAGF